MGPAARDARPFLVAVAVAVIALVVLLVVSPARFMTEDDAKYLGIGANMAAGDGPTTVFGTFFPYHSPLWPVFVVGPHALVGADPVLWAHILAIASAAGIVLCAAWFGWRITPLAGVLAAAVMVGFPYFLDLGRGLGLDLPVAVLSLLYVIVGLDAVRRRSMGRAAAAGALFAVAFLVKETALPFAPVPFLAGLARGVPVRPTVRLASLAMLVGAFGTSWWFVVYAQNTGSVYRLGTPGWTLVPIGIALVVLGIAGLWLGGRGGTEEAASGGPAAGSPGRVGPVQLGWIGTIVWTVALTAFFAKTRAGTSASFLAPAEVRYYVATWLPELGLVLAVGLVGGVIALVERLRISRAARAVRAAGTDRAAPPDPERGWDLDLASVDDLVIASLCGLPLVLLVVSVGEVPRHYIAQLAILVALGSAGWIQLVRRLLRQPDRLAVATLVLGLLASVALLVPAARDASETRRTAALLGPVLVIAVIAAIGLVLHGRRDPHAPRRTMDVLVAVAVVVAIGAAAISVLRPSSEMDATKAATVKAAGDWIRANVPAGETVGFGSILGYETAITLQDAYPAVKMAETQGLRIDPDTPLGVRRPGEEPADDWVSLTGAPKVVSSLYGYRASQLAERIRELGVRVWVQNSRTGAANGTTIDDALRDAAGVTASTTTTRPYGSSQIDSTVYAIDPDRLSFGPRVMVSVTALERIVSALEADRAHGPATAARLLPRVTVEPAGAAADAVLARLRAITSP